MNVLFRMRKTLKAGSALVIEPAGLPCIRMLPPRKKETRTHSAMPNKRKQQSPTDPPQSSALPGPQALIPVRRHARGRRRTLRRLIRFAPETPVQPGTLRPGPQQRRRVRALPPFVRPRVVRAGPHVRGEVLLPRVAGGVGLVLGVQATELVRGSGPRLARPPPALADEVEEAGHDERGGEARTTGVDRYVGGLREVVPLLREGLFGLSEDGFDGGGVAPFFGPGLALWVFFPHHFPLHRGAWQS